MPSHSLTPYKVILREKGDPDNHWNLKNLIAHDRKLPDNDVIKTFADLCEYYTSNAATDSDLENTFHIEKYSVEENIVEGIIRTGNHGYSSTLRDINTNETRKKRYSEAEELPFYFVFVVPQTKRGELYENGEEGILALQRINRRGVKTTLQKRLRERFTVGTDDTILEMRPVYTQEVLEKLLDAERVLEARFEMKERDGDDETLYRLMEGVDTMDSRSESVVLKSNRGGSLDKFKDIARGLKEKDGSFAEIVQDDVGDLSVEIEKENGRNETFSLLEDSLRMSKRLDNDDLRTYEGLPTTSSIANHARQYINEILPTDIVEPLEVRTDLPNIRATQDIVHQG